ncbi:MAG: hypothetical protein GY730_07680 [bacterium]|nr:hypothetical protein [bacterium]
MSETIADNAAMVTAYLKTTIDRKKSAARKRKCTTKLHRKKIWLTSRQVKALKLIQEHYQISFSESVREVLDSIINGTLVKNIKKDIADVPDRLALFNKNQNKGA